ncbi:MAG TPA: PA domain-containing protein [Dyella sp.]
MNRRKLVFLCIALSAGFAPGMASAAEIRIVNQDVGTRKGLDDPTPVTPIGGNPGKTRGEQALIVFRFAADLWGAVLKSDVPVINNATFKDLSCTATSGTLGSSGTTSVFAFSSPPPAGALAGVWYHSALTDALAGEDADPGQADIQSQFNGKMGSTGCLEGASWYFGLDGKTPAGQINFLNVVLHEMAHGLGFSGFNTLSTGAQLQSRSDIYSTFVKDNLTGKAWTKMTNAERKVAALNDTHLVFTGASVKAEAPLALKPLITLSVTAPAVIAGAYDYSTASFGPAATAANFSGAVYRPSDPLACDAVDAGVRGKVALIDRGTCGFTIKVKNAQVAGATAVIIANNQAGTISPAGDDVTVTIPTLAVTQAVGNAFKANLSNLAVAFGADPQHRLAGGDVDGNVLLYAPTTLAQGSSFSHYDTRLTPNALMEYAINADLVGQIDLDLTPALFKDEGWKLNEGTQALLTCDTGIPTWLPGGVIVGANVISNLKAQAAAATTFASYRSAALTYAARLASSGLISQSQASRLNACLADATLLKQFAAWGPGTGAGEPSGPTAIVLQNGVTLGGQSGAAGDEAVYQLSVPAGARSLVLRTFGGSGDVSLYVKVGAVPTTANFDAQSVHVGNNESVVIARPAAGIYYLKLVGAMTYAGVNVQGSYTAP